jgi:hypothetical protein
VDKGTRNRIQAATQKARARLEDELRQQLEGVFDIRPDGTIGAIGPQLTSRQRMLREKILAAVEHERAGGRSPAEAVAAYTREAAFTTLNRFVALKMLEARELLLPCICDGEQSSGFKEYARLGLADGLVQLDDHGYRLYIESQFDEIAREIGVLFDRRDATSLLWPGRLALAELLQTLNDAELSTVWVEDETIGWVYQYFNSEDERREMRAESQTPRNSREMAVRNQFFTPRYVVEFLTDNTLGRIWYEMRRGETRLTKRCKYLVRRPEEATISTWRDMQDPRDIRVLDPACGSGHFLLYAFDLLVVMYEEGWADPKAPASSLTGGTLREDYPDRRDLHRVLPNLILERNLFGIDIDSRCVQIAAVALWMRAQREFADLGVDRDTRPPVTRVNTVVAEPMPGDGAAARDFASSLRPPVLGGLFTQIQEEMRLAGELGSLLRIERSIAGAISRTFQEYVTRSTRPSLPGMELVRQEGELDLSGINDEAFFVEAEERILEELTHFASSRGGAGGVQRRLFADDAGQGMAFIDVLRHRYAVVLMNPPFGAGSAIAKQAFEEAYARTKTNVYAAFVERGIELLQDRGLLGAITSRTGFFLSSFQKWREEIVLHEAPPVVVADLGYGVLDAAMVEVAAYCLERRPRETA